MSGNLILHIPILAFVNPIKDEQRWFYFDHNQVYTTDKMAALINDFSEILFLMYELPEKSLQEMLDDSHATALSNSFLNVSIHDQ